MDWLIGKSKKKDKEIGNESLTAIKNKIPLYLEPNNCTTAFLSVIEMRDLVMIPPGINSREWLALQTYYVFENFNLIYDVLSIYCTPISCPIMVGTGNMIYHWFDDKGKKTKVNAPQFIDHVLTNIQKNILEETIFPTKYGNQFPSNFESQITKYIKWLFQVMSHIYHSHYGQLVSLFGLNSHLNTLFVHLIALSSQIDRTDNKPMTNLDNSGNTFNNVNDIINSSSNISISEPANINENLTTSSTPNILPNSLSLNSMSTVLAPLNYSITKDTYIGANSSSSNAMFSHFSTSNSILPIDQQLLAPFLNDSNPLTELINLLRILKNDQIENNSVDSIKCQELLQNCQQPQFQSFSPNINNNLLPVNKCFHVAEKSLKEEKRKSGSSSNFSNQVSYQNQI